jgi:CBS domain containing-hemolysin-like protein
VRDILPLRSTGSTLRESLEEAIEEHGGEASGADDLDPQERTMLRNMLDLSDRKVGEVAVPRSDIIALDVGADFAEMVATFREAGHSRLPVWEGSPDEIRGMLHIKDVYAVLADWTAAGAVPPLPAPPVESLLRQVLFVPPSMPVTDLLADMQRLRTHMAIVVDEYGGTDGLVTIEDIVEEIVGEIEDEHDEEPADAPLRPLPDGSFLADARLPLDELVLGTAAPLELGELAEEVDTIGGLVVLLAGRVPVAEEEVEHPGGWRFRVLASDGRRIERLQLIPPGVDAD